MDLAEALASAGLTVVSCATAAEARSRLRSESFGVAILDVVLPDGDGVELLKEIRTSPATIRLAVMLLSTEADVRDRIRGLSTGADDYVGKPYETTYVVARAWDMIRRARGPSAERIVLVIEDSLTFRETLRQALEGASYRVVCAGTGEEGLRVAAAVRPTAIVVDGVMPGIDGATVIRRIRLDVALRRTPCLLLTASEESASEVEALEAGADGFVRKNERLDVILARLGAILRTGASGPDAEVPTPSSLAGPKKILAVDDSPTYLNLLASTLREAGFDVAVSGSGEEALDLLAVQTVDCVLLDLIMPGHGGELTCRRIKGAPGTRDIPVILLTALEDRDTMIRGFDAGADDYIAKSSDFSVLKARVSAQIRRKQFEDETRDIREQLLRRQVEATEARAARELSETRAALAEDLRRKNAELEAFSYSVSHDLRAPLRSIDGFSKALLEDFSAELPAQAQEYLGRVRSAAKRMGELIDDLIELSRVERSELRRERVDVSRIATDVAASLQRSAPERQVEWVIERGIAAAADPRLFRIVLENLMGNAWKFTAKMANTRIELGATTEADSPTFFVKDNGAGFDATRSAMLFAPFQRFHSESDFPGTGIGLATVQRIVGRHGGRVWAESAPGQGATFRWTVAPTKPGSQPLLARDERGTTE
jgi:DNA-binding response OmpR family regulator